MKSVNQPDSGAPNNTPSYAQSHEPTGRAGSISQTLTFKENLSHTNTQRERERERDIRGKKNRKTQTYKTKREQPLLSTCLLVMRKTKAQQGSPHLIGLSMAPTTSYAHTSRSHVRASYISRKCCLK